MKRLAQAAMLIRPSRWICIFGVDNIDSLAIIYSMAWLAYIKIILPKSVKLQDQQPRSRFIPLILVIFCHTTHKLQNAIQNAGFQVEGKNSEEA